MTASTGAIDIQSVSKTFGSVRAVDDVSFGLEPGTFFALLGPSGSGKTTLLRLIAGFEQPTGGSIVIGGTAVQGVPAHQRPVNTVFQNYALFPHMTVAANVGYSLRQKRPRPNRAEIKRKVDDVLELVQLGGFAPRRIWEMSGGQQQRVALARALVSRPQILLLDEPLSALDAKLRDEMQTELKSLQREVGITFIFVTHNQEEAMSMADRVAVMREGKLLQNASPEVLYDQPADTFVADFVGSMNLFHGVLSGSVSDAVDVKTFAGGELVGRASGHNFKVGDHVALAVRPEHVTISPRSSADSDSSGAARGTRLTGRITHRTFLGDHQVYRADVKGIGLIEVTAPRGISQRGEELKPGDEAVVGWPLAATRVIPDFDKTSTEEGGEQSAT